MKRFARALLLCVFAALFGACETVEPVYSGANGDGSEEIDRLKTLYKDAIRVPITPHIVNQIRKEKKEHLFGEIRYYTSVNIVLVRDRAGVSSLELETLNLEPETAQELLSPQDGQTITILTFKEGGSLLNQSRISKDDEGYLGSISQEGDVFEIVYPQRLITLGFVLNREKNWYDLEFAIEQSEEGRVPLALTGARPHLLIYYQTVFSDVGETRIQLDSPPAQPVENSSAFVEQNPALAQVPSPQIPQPGPNNGVQPVNGAVPPVNDPVQPVNGTVPPADETAPPLNEVAQPVDEAAQPADEAAPVDEAAPSMAVVPPAGNPVQAADQAVAKAEPPEEPVQSTPSSPAVRQDIDQSGLEAGPPAGNVPAVSEAPKPGNFAGEPAPEGDTQDQNLSETVIFLEPAEKSTFTGPPESPPVPVISSLDQEEEDPNSIKVVLIMGGSAPAGTTGAGVRTVSSAASSVRENRVPGNYYTIQVGAFRDQKNAALAYAALERGGFTPLYECYQDLTRVVIPEVDQKDLARTRERVRALGFGEPYIRQ